MPGFHEVVEGRHELQDPTSVEKIRLLGERLELGPDTRVLDLGSGRAGVAIVLAESYGCHLTCVEWSDGFHRAAVERVRARGLDTVIELVHGDAADYVADARVHDVAMCLGAAFIWGGLRETLEVLTPLARDGGSVAVGEPYWRTWPPPEMVDPEWREEFLSLEATIGRFREAGLAPVVLIDASLDDWDRYETLQWHTGEAWLREHPDDLDTAEIRRELDTSRDRYLRWQRETLGWAIVVGRKPEG